MASLCFSYTFFYNENFHSTSNVTNNLIIEVQGLSRTPYALIMLHIFLLLIEYFVLNIIFNRHLARVRIK